MAIKNFKKIEERKGYLVEDDDRQIFEKEIGRSYFGLGAADMIEFILYDSNDNPLPQGDSGKLVRYINLNDGEAEKYFLISRNEFTKKANDAPEMVFDLEQLIRDAGYNVGVFKTQLTLLNRRAGKEEIDNDKLWIHEISPSRTEIRLLPIKNTDNPSEDLLRRYDTFVNQKEFRDDTIYFVEIYVQSLDVQRIFDRFLRIRGAVASGQQYISLIKNEFKINSVEEFFATIKSKVVEAMLNFARGRNYHITDINYGQPEPSIDLVELSIDQIKRTVSEVLIEVIDFYLLKRNIQDKNVLTKEQQITFDEVKRILKTVRGNGIYTSTIPEEVTAQQRGCTNPDATNFNPTAIVDDGSCLFEQDKEPKKPKGGCTNPEAENYDPRATFDDGSCKYEKIGGTSGGSTINTGEEIEDIEDNTPPIIVCQDANAKNTGQEGECIYPPETETKTWYVWSTSADVRWVNDEKITTKTYNEYDEFRITYNVGELTTIQGDIREYAKSKPIPIETRQYYILNISNRTTGGNPTPDPFNPPSGDYPPPGFSTGRPMVVKYQDKLGNQVDTGTISPGSDVSICAKRGSVVPMEGIKIIEQGECGYYPAPTLEFGGCTNSRAENYDPLATTDDGSCIIRGCTNSRAENYDPSATFDDGSCFFPTPSGGGGTSTPGGEGEQGQPPLGSGNRTGNPLNDLENEQRERRRLTEREL